MEETLKIKVLVAIAGIDFSYYPGQIADVRKSIAEEWVQIGYAVLLDQTPTDVEPDIVEQRVTDTPETATKPARRKRG